MAFLSCHDVKSPYLTISCCIKSWIETREFLYCLKLINIIFATSLNAGGNKLDIFSNSYAQSECRIYLVD